MALSNIEVMAEIRAERLVFDPPVPEESRRIGSSSVDLLLHEDLIILPQGPQQGVKIDPDTVGNPTELLRMLGEEFSIRDKLYELEPHHLIIGKTLEHVTLPAHLAARIEGKSTLARFGLSVHVTAPTVLAGFTGHLYLEINNVGPFAIQLKHGMEIAQLILEHVGLPPTEAYGGRYQGQV